MIAALALGTAGCGSSHPPGTGTDPALLAPASAPLYIGAVVTPSQPLRDAALVAARTLSGGANPYARLLTLLQTPASAKLDYARDVRPWLGVRAGAFVAHGARAGSGGLDRVLTLLGGALGAETQPVGEFPFSSGVEGALILDTSDAAKARSFVASQAARAGASAKAYRGVSYRATAAGVAFAIVKGLVVIGSEQAVREVIDTASGSPALAGTSTYARLAAVAPAGALARLYLNGLAPGAAGGASSASTLIEQLDGGRPLSASVIPSSNTIAVDLDTLSAGSAPAPGGLLAALGEGATAFGELPPDAWLGIGLATGGPQGGAAIRDLRGVLSALSSSASSSGAQISVKGLLGSFLAPLEVLGADTPSARADFQSWMASAGLFASGTGLLDVKGGVEILSRSPARSHAAVAKLAAALRRSGTQVTPIEIPGTDAAVAAHLATLPVALDIADGRGASGRTKFVIGLGEGSVTAALAGPQTLAGGPVASAAAAALGESIQPSLSVDFPTLLGLLEGVGLTEDRTIAPLVGYLRKLTTLAGGSSRPAADVQRLRLSLGLRASGSEPAA